MFITHTWTLLEGASLPGGHTLRECLGSDQRAAFFRATLGSEETVLVKLVPVEPIGAGADSEAQLALWRRTRHLNHVHLIPLFEYGRTHIASDDYIYAVFEYPDERLAAALGQGPLTESQVWDVLEAVRGALHYIHAQGLVHGALNAGQVVAVGDSIKLATDSLRESSDIQHGHAEDIRALGALVYELLTGAGLPKGKVPDVSALEEPFRTIVERAAEPDRRNRWTLAEIAAFLRRSPRPVPRAVETKPLRASAVEAPPGTAAVETPPGAAGFEDAPGTAAVENPAGAAAFEAPPGVATESPVSEAPAEREAEPSPKAAAPALRSRPRAGHNALIPRWIYYGMGALLLWIVVLNVSRRSGSNTQAPAPVTHTTLRPPAKPVFREPQGSADRTPQQILNKTPQAPATKTPQAPATKAPQASAGNPAAPGKPIWRVIAYTYASRSAAEKKIREINRKLPGLRAQAFVPAGRKDMCLVALGGRMTREDALRLLRRARGEGLPRDMYVQNYLE